jgi:hypothetical protein
MRAFYWRIGGIQFVPQQFYLDYLIFLTSLHALQTLFELGSPQLSQ